MNARFESLKNSIMFNLSLSSKELFHSNFLGYLFSHYDTLFGEIVGIKDFKTKEVKREYKNIDIEITGDNGKKYLVENKVKDIIGSEQLKKIQTKNKYENYEYYYLFSLLGNNLKNIEGIDSKWIEIKYEDIITVLNKYHFDKTIESYKKDYCAFMFNMISLLKEHYDNCDKYLLFWGKKNENPLLKQYEEVRLHDVFQKYGVSHFVNYFRDEYKDAKIEASCGYNRNGNMTFSSKEVKNIVYGIDIEIQIENGMYRKSIVCPEEGREILLEKYKSLGWFKNWESPRKKEPYLSYDHKDKYGTRRWYQYENIKNISYDDLAKKIKTDFDEVSNALKKDTG